MPGPGVLDEIRHAALLAWRQFIPRFEDREVLAWRTLPQAFLYLAPFFFMAFLVRREDTHLMRLLLLPTVLSAAVWCTFRFKSNDPRMAWYEWDRGLLALVVIAKSLDYACAADGRRKVGEKELSPIYEPHAVPAGAIGGGKAQGKDAGEDTPADEGDSNGGPPTEGRDAFPRAPAGSPPRSPRNPLLDAFEVSFAMRGVGWDFGRHVYVPRAPSALPAERSAFVKATVWRLVRNQLLIDVVDVLEKTVPGVSASEGGGTIFLAQLPPLRRYALAALLHLAHGLLIRAGVALVYDYLALGGVFVLGQSPSAWPPIDGDLRRTRSLHEFWARGWHQALRYTFLTFGGFPGRWVAGDVGMVLGTFLASGLFHEVGLTVAGKDVDYRVVVFFLLQAVGIVLEKAFRAVMGRRVGGVFGTVWALVFVLGFGQMCTDAWFARGIGGAWSIPPFMSVVRPMLALYARFS